MGRHVALHMETLYLMVMVTLYLMVTAIMDVRVGSLHLMDQDRNANGQKKAPSMGAATDGRSRGVATGIRDEMCCC